MDHQVQAVAERLAVTLAGAGMQRMHARVLAAVLFSDREAVTASDLAAQVGASAGSISMSLTMLRTVGLIESVPAPGSRSVHVRLRQDAWATLFGSQNAMIGFMVEIGAAGLDVVDPDGPAALRLRELRDFHAFILAEFPAVLARWHHRTPGHSPP